MKNKLTQKVLTFGCIGVAITTSFLPFTPTASAKTLARAHGRCKLTQQDFKAFDGYCIIKQKQEGNNTIFVVELDDDTEYSFFGPNKQALQVETYDGIHNVQFREESDKGMFIWQEEGITNTLSVKLDTQHDPNVSHDSSAEEAVGTVLGAAIGAVIGNLISGGQSNQSSSASSPKVEYGQTVPKLEDLVGAKAGQAENALRERGYEWRNTSEQGDSVYSNWTESATGNCVAIRTNDGRYQSIIYTPTADCDR